MTKQTWTPAKRAAFAKKMKAAKEAKAIEDRGVHYLAPKKRAKKNPPREIDGRAFIDFEPVGAKSVGANKNPPIGLRQPAREALSALYTLSRSDSDQAAAIFERLIGADRDSLVVARLPLATTGRRTVRLWWLDEGAPIQMRVTFEDESTSKATFAAFNERHRV